MSESLRRISPLSLEEFLSLGAQDAVYAHNISGARLRAMCPTADVPDDCVILGVFDCQGGHFLTDANSLDEARGIAIQNGYQLVTLH